jgi:hypothetical protein
MIDELIFPDGCRLFQRWQEGDPQALNRLKEIFDKTIDGDYDEVFAQKPSQNSVQASASINLFVLAILTSLYGLNSAEAYKGDAKRYVRVSLMIRKLLGLPKLYLEWPVYALTAESLGAVMMYPVGAPPGTDPGIPLINKDNWRDLKAPEMDSEIPKLFDDMLDFYQDLTGLEPVLHLTAPYSLAADIYGQSELATAISDEPEHVNNLLNHLVDKVLTPWGDHFFEKFPNGWLELSDASGSPFFIGPENCKDMAIRSILRLKNENLWGTRVYDANYRGDYVTQAKKTARSPRRRVTTQNGHRNGLSFSELFAVKQEVCTDYVMRLHDDRMPLNLYQERAIDLNVPIFIGIGATQIDRNSIDDMDTTRDMIKTLSIEYVESIKTVAHTIQNNNYSLRVPPWPGTIYFEDVSANSSMEVIEIIVSSVLEQGSLKV